MLAMGVRLQSAVTWNGNTDELHLVFVSRLL